MNSGDKQVKPFKLCFNNEIHRISKLPEDYKALLQNVVLAFKSSLPNQWALQYEDADGDRVMLTSDDDYKAMLECEMDSEAKSIKIFLLPLEEKVPTEISQSIPNDISKSDKLDDYSHILGEQKDENIVNEMKEEPVSEPVVEQIKEIEPELKEEVVPPKEEVPEQPQELVNEVQLEVDPKPIEQVNQPEKYFDVEINIEGEDVRPAEPQDQDSKPECPKMRGKCPAMWKHKKEKMRGFIKDLLVEQIPTIAELVKDYLNNPSGFNAEEAKKKVHSNDESTQVHERVCCDGCGINPIIGVRYKCSICEDFDYCQKCESSIEHSHPFLKIKDPKNHPKTMITVIEDNFPQGHNVISQVSKAIQEVAGKILGNQFQNKEEEKIEIEDPEQKVEKKVEEPKKKEEGFLFGISFVKEVCTIPAKITVNDKAIYKTVSLKNTGTNEWPSNSSLRNIGGVAGQDTRVVQLAPGKDFSCILILENPAKAGEYTSTWRLSYIDDKGELQFAGEPFTVAFNVVEPEVPRKEEPKVEKPKVEEPKIEEPKKEEPKKEEKPKKEYTQKVTDLARNLKEIFPEANIDDLLEIVAHSQNPTIESLVETYLASQ